MLLIMFPMPAEDCFRFVRLVLSGRVKLLGFLSIENRNSENVGTIVCIYLLQFRGAVFFILAVLGILLFDHDDHLHQNENHILSCACTINLCILSTLLSTSLACICLGNCFLTALHQKLIGRRTKAFWRTCLST